MLLSIISTVSHWLALVRVLLFYFLRILCTIRKIGHAPLPSFLEEERETIGGRISPNITKLLLTLVNRTWQHQLIRL